MKASYVTPATRARKRAVYSPWSEPTFADSTQGDNVDGEDLDVRRAAGNRLADDRFHNPDHRSVIVRGLVDGRFFGGTHGGCGVDSRQADGAAASG